VNATVRYYAVARLYTRNQFLLLFCRFFCGRIITKYMMIKMKMNGTKKPMPLAGLAVEAALCA